jgi:hypothetical protein
MFFFIKGDFHPQSIMWCTINVTVAPLLWPSVGVKPNTWKSWDLESSGTPECSKLDNKGQNTSHWGVLGVVGKVLKRRYRKWPRIGNSNICNSSYGQKKGRESKIVGPNSRNIGTSYWQQNICLCLCFDHLVVSKDYLKNGNHLWFGTHKWWTMKTTFTCLIP